MKAKVIGKHIWCCDCSFEVGRACFPWDYQRIEKTINRNQLTIPCATPKCTAKLILTELPVGKKQEGGAE